MSRQNLLLDTHTWIWFVAGSNQLTNNSCVASIESAIKTSSVFLSSISLWETAMLVAKKRITLSMNVLDWMKRGLYETGIQTIDLTPEIAAESCGLGEDFHGDPADRIIVASARVQSCTLVTRDARILDYARKGSCKVIPV